MLQNIYRSTRGVGAYVIIAFIAVPFTMFGIDWLFTGQPGAETVFEVNGEGITAGELQRETDLRRRYFVNNDVEMPTDEVLQRSALNSLVEERALRQEAEAWGMEVPDHLVDVYIRKVSDFQRGGIFSRELYQQVLRDNGYTPSAHRGVVRRQLLRAQMLSGFADTAFVTDSQLRRIVAVSEQKRRFDVIHVAIEPLMEGIEIGEATARAAYDADPEGFMSEERVVVDYVELKREDLFSVISDIVVHEQYELLASNAEQERRVAHILLELDGADGAADAARARLLEFKRQVVEDGADFADLAQAHSGDAGSARNGGYLGTSRGDTFPAAFEAALNALEVGALSDPVLTDAGMHLIKRMPADVPEYEDLEDQIRESLQRQQSENAFVEASELLDEFAFNQPDLSSAYQDLLLTVKTSEPFGRHLSQGLFANAQLVEAAFSAEALQEGRNSPVVEVDPDHLIVLNVREHLLPARRDFDEVLESIERRMRRERATVEAAGHVEALLAGLATRPDVEALASERGLDFGRHDLQSRGEASSALDYKIVQKAFSLQRPDESQPARPRTGRAGTDAGDLAVIALWEVRDGDLESVTPEERDRITEYISSNEGDALARAYRAALMQRAELQTL